jgi:hypothetical protein
VLRLGTDSTYCWVSGSRAARKPVSLALVRRSSSSSVPGSSCLKICQYVCGMCTRHLPYRQMLTHAQAPDQVLPEFNSSMARGGDPTIINVNLPYTGLEFHYVFQIIMGCLVFLIIPGIGMLYGGMCKRKSALSMIFQSLSVISVITFQWIFWGYTLAFSRTGSSFIGDMSEFGMKNVRVRPDRDLLETVLETEMLTLRPNRSLSRHLGAQR